MKLCRPRRAQVATLSLPKLGSSIANKLLPRIETNLTNGELWQLLFKTARAAGKAGTADNSARTRGDVAAGSPSGLQSSLIGCDFAAEADRLGHVSYGGSRPEKERQTACLRQPRLHKK
ncbi:MAG: hypothetical protein V8T36_04350 [Ruthenibacterium lactatiformans]